MEHGQSGTGVDRADRGSPAGGWVFPALLVLVLVVGAWVAQRGPKGEPPITGSAPIAKWTPTLPPQGESVGLEIDFGNGARKYYEALPWHEGMTVAALLREAVAYRPGIVFSQQGEAETGFLTSLDGLNNQGAGGPNWRYEVNGKFSDVSFCLQPLAPGDRVLWKFTATE